MVARILSLLAGVLFAGIGWAIVAPNGMAGIELPAIELGMFEGHRPFIGWGAAAVGIVAPLSPVLPRHGGGGGGKRPPGPLVTCPLRQASARRSSQGTRRQSSRQPVIA